MRVSMNLLSYLTLFIAGMSGFTAGFLCANWLSEAKKASENPLLETLLRLRCLEERVRESKCENEEAKHYLCVARAHFEHALGALHFPMGEQHYYKRAICSFHIQNAENLLILAEGILNNLHSECKSDAASSDHQWR